VEVLLDVLRWLAIVWIALLGCWWAVISGWAVVDLVRERPKRFRRAAVTLVIAKTVPGLLIVAAAFTGSWTILITAVVIAVGASIVGSAMERLGIPLVDEGAAHAPAQETVSRLGR
jgi:hypothetical protein